MDYIFKRIESAFNYFCFNLTYNSSYSPNFLARYLQMALLCEIFTPCTSSIGSWLNGVPASATCEQENKEMGFFLRVEFVRT